MEHTQTLVTFFGWIPPCGVEGEISSGIPGF